VADAVSPVSGHPELGIESVEGLLGGPLGRPLMVLGPERAAWLADQARVRFHPAS
jgi:hypothetical protein